MTEGRIEEVRQAKLVYVLYLVGLVFPVTLIVGVVWAHVAREDSAAWLETHHRYQIRTFWLGLLYAVTGTILMMVVVGIVVLVAATIWLIVRCVKGLRQLDRRQPIENVETWLF